MRPLVEGHMGRLDGKDSTTTGDPKAPSWPNAKDGKKVEAWTMAAVRPGSRQPTTSRPTRS